VPNRERSADCNGPMLTTSGAGTHRSTTSAPMKTNATNAASSGYGPEQEVEVLDRTRLLEVRGAHSPCDAGRVTPGELSGVGLRESRF
jgi:hypothetical protein